MRNEPVLTAASVTAVIVAGINVLSALDIVQWDEGQLEAINAFVVVAVSLAFGVWARSKVTPV